ncbi:hypothetical protein FGU71_09950 [Erythrobacter insulae]|uniref:Uncharacterized protein n=1 Tax=Erythrobacter insulae TaxID=2584124 RepID=A0A547PDE1_9SPHN|nr:hypothetical protein [Erythrobacter insulae]TRD12149.1 hypothetical protein FGU71_09950 [Erythrobacter insulae]
MESKYGSRRKPSSAKGILLAAVSSFAIGGALVGYVVWYNIGSDPATEADQTPAIAAASPSAAPIAEISPTPTPLSEPIEPESAEEAVEAVSGLAEQQGGLDQRLAAAEQRLARLDLQAQAAAGNAARAEGLLIAFATRRAVERGAELGYLADQLRLRFGDERPNAVGTIINFARSDPPIRLDTLLARLEGLGPQLAATEEGPSWAKFQREIGELFIIRREDTPSPQPERRLERARYALEQGRYQNAIDEIKNMPGAEKAESWIADAEKFRDAMAALENIETAAVLDQGGLRDGTGNLINQPSPVGSSGGD